ncbi:Glucose-methanol-choline oxidoreductase, N-terminal,FAD/NAD(P)-binding domain [Cinara cedri]|uniref:Glucose-methanol-choline oxidoreductase, N-terminal,FAD/NAD(P)-binding domain n=1 Tax=Cinara cedri TaxID=506608 RepID=A0A5E4MPF0_9HEMI|nr:Glucose-methanol-choline oxidoreductase, N-terminal,FAD/NAD(P)-binding domain [Cinara cedri]
MGAGAAGAPVARRLAEVPEWNILLLEAGGEESLINSFPAIAHYLQFTDYDWAYRTDKEPHACKGHTEKVYFWPAGKTLGDSTIINDMYTRGNVRDFDWLAYAGNLGWSYGDVLLYFMKNEDVKVPELKRSRYHGVGGPLSINHPSYKSKLIVAFLET